MYIDNAIMYFCDYALAEIRSNKRVYAEDTSDVSD